ncbi:serine hydrolase [Arthrobacter sp. UKPF54-2]|nr:serine hydrolase [Arthrobacter sp. UKPF54-2]
MALTPSIGPDLEAQLNGIIHSYPGYQLGVALIDLADGAVHEYGVRTKFTAASTAKVLAAAAYYRLAETGELSLDEPMGVSTAGLQIRQMIQQSNNESWAMILEALGSRRLTDYAASIGIEYDRAYNKLTPAETARTLALLYTGQLLNAANTAQLLSYMQNTNLETLIPAALPPDVVVFHKYGLLYGNLHDASILVRGGKAYAFVVYTLGRSPAEITSRTRVIHLLTRTVSAALFPG